jgi:hypothetical protein
MATKRITITPDVLVRILKYTRDTKGNPVLPPMDKPFVVKRSWFNPNYHQFEIDVESESFDQHPFSPQRFPQDFVIKL